MISQARPQATIRESINSLRPGLAPFLIAPSESFRVCQTAPQRLSLLEVVLDDESVAMVRRRMSPAAGSSGLDSGTSADTLIQGWSQICSSVGRSEGRKARHHLISCWHSVESRDGIRMRTAKGCSTVSLFLYNNCL